MEKCSQKKSFNFNTVKNTTYLEVRVTDECKHTLGRGQLLSRSIKSHAVALVKGPLESE